MTFRFQWFRPATGDGRDIAGGGLGVAVAAAGAVAARYASVDPAWGEPPRAVSAKLGWIGELTAGLGQAPPRFGIRPHVIARATAGEAWRAAGRLIERVDDDMIRKVQAGLARSEPAGQRRMREPRQGDRTSVTIAPNPRAGAGLAAAARAPAGDGPVRPDGDRVSPALVSARHPCQPALRPRVPGQPPQPRR